MTTAATTRGFKSPKRVLGQVDTEGAAKAIAAAADISLIIDRKGVILDVAFGSHDFQIPGHDAWIGQNWTDTVTVESKPKIESIIEEAAAGQPSRWRQINYPSKADDDIPVLYSAVQVGSKGRMVVLGRELRSMSEVQQRLMTAQQSIEREYARLRELETRYKLLFQIATEAVIIVDAASLRIVEINPTANKLFGASNRKIVGQNFLRHFDPESEAALKAVLSTVRGRGTTEEVITRLRGGSGSFVASISMLRQDDAIHYMVRLLPETRASLLPEVTMNNAALLGLVDKIPDGFVITDSAGTILSANTSFVEMVRAATEDQLRGRSLGDFIGRRDNDLDLLLTNLREFGAIRHFTTTLRSTVDTIDDIELSAAAVSIGDQSSFGFTLRTISDRAAKDSGGDSALPRSAEEMTRLIGRVPLKDLVRETTDIIERLCIEAALELTQDNRASAAEMLGLSRQSLYTKMHRYGLSDDSSD